MPSILIIGATRGLGYELAKQYASKGLHRVTGTARSGPPKDADSSIQWISGVDVAEEAAGKTIANGLKGQQQDIVIYSAGYFPKECFDEPAFDEEKAGLLKKGTKLILVSSEAGSIGLRHESEGGGNFAHHASKAALNMVGKLLSFDLKDAGVAVGMVHPAFMRTDMTKGVGFDKFWDDGGAVMPEESARSLGEWVDGFDMSRSGTYWAPRGPGDIGTAEHVLGPKDNLSTPLQLPW